VTDVWDEDLSDYSKNQMDNTDFACRFTKDDIDNYKHAKAKFQCLFEAETFHLIIPHLKYHTIKPAF
jgi:hypothetical protein